MSTLGPKYVPEVVHKGTHLEELVKIGHQDKPKSLQESHHLGKDQM